jgi:hypothetical protein
MINIDNNTIYTFNQYNRIKGNNINIGYIDTAMVIIHFNLCKNIKWKLGKYEADGYYIKECIDNNLRVMDMTAFTLCMENKLPIIVFDMNEPGNLKRVVMGEKVGTLVS